MNNRQFKELKVGDHVITNGLSRSNSGIKCEVTYICEDRIWIKPLKGERDFTDGCWAFPDWNEISYKAANLL